MAGARGNVRSRMIRKRTRIKVKAPFRGTSPSTAILLLCLPAVICGCIDFGLSFGPLFPIGQPFVIKGVAEEIDTDSSLRLIWRGDNGITYHLFQSSLVPNGDFDKATTPGVTSRLLVVTRDDLAVDPKVGTIVEVRRILEIVE